MKELRADFIFSYWIFIWFILFELNFIPFNPFIILVFALIINTIDFLIKIFLKYSHKSLLYYFIINIFIKILPIVILLFQRQNTFSSEDLDFTIIYFILFLIWSYDINKNEIVFTFLQKEKERKFIPPFEYYFIKYI